MQNFQKYKKLLSILGSMLMIVLVFKFTSTDSVNGQVKVELEAENLITQVIKVHVDGAVVNEGVYELASDARVEDAIEAAGGLSENANPELLNYAKVLTDGEKITVMKQFDREESKLSAENSISQSDDYSILEKINYMTVEEFQEVPGIGEKISQEIIKVREDQGGFSNVEELKLVSGIGDSKYNKIVNYLQ